MGETTNLNWLAGFLPSTVYSPSWLRFEQIITKLLNFSLQRWSKLRTYPLRWWQKHCASCIQVLWNRKMALQTLWDGIWLRWSDWNHVESRVKEVIQWSKIWSKHLCIKKMSSFPVFLPYKKSLAFPKDLVDQKHQQKPTKPRWSCRWCGYWVFGICSQVRHYRWAWNFGGSGRYGDWDVWKLVGILEKICDDMIKHVWFEEKQTGFECSMPWEMLGLLLT